jgi:hypothetical protein
MRGGVSGGDSDRKEAEREQSHIQPELERLARVKRRKKSL